MAAAELAVLRASSLASNVFVSWSEVQSQASLDISDETTQAIKTSLAQVKASLKTAHSIAAYMGTEAATMSFDRASKCRTDAEATLEKVHDQAQNALQDIFAFGQKTKPPKDQARSEVVEEHARATLSAAQATSLSKITIFLASKCSATDAASACQQAADVALGVLEASMYLKENSPDVLQELEKLSVRASEALSKARRSAEIAMSVFVPHHSGLGATVSGKAILVAISIGAAGVAAVVEQVKNHMELQASGADLDQEKKTSWAALQEVAIQVKLIAKSSRTFLDQVWAAPLKTYLARSD